jgi:putative DNA primase/helicase
VTGSGADNGIGKSDALAKVHALGKAQLTDAWAAAAAAGIKPDTPKWEAFIDSEVAQNREYMEAAVAFQKKWDAAPDADPSHPYLVRKGVTSAPGLKQDGDVLLVPMKGLEKGAPLMNIQRISPDGKKLFGKGGRAMRTRTTIGVEAFKKTGTLYIVEGWVTGWTVYHVTGEAVVVAFSAGNLHHVAVAMREKYPKATIIIAADNDRWSGAANPGVTQAREAAASSHALVAIPDFASLDTRPTDFNDLFLAEGEEAVRRWLDPAHADEAATSAPVVVPSAPVPPPVDDGPDLEPPPEEDEEAPMPPPRPVTWQDRAPFRCLGFDRGTYFYLPRGTGQITELTAAMHDRKWLLPLASASWWEQEFPAAKGADWHTAADALLRASHRAGVFRPERLRGRGCWPEEGPDGERSILLHLGDRLLPGGGKAFVDPERYEGTERLIYERLPRLTGPSSKRALDLDEARELLALFQDLLWHDEASGSLLAGWTVLAPVCGALAWRPHVWVTGGAGAGKSVVLSKLVRPSLGGMERYYEGGTTEAGIRQELRADALPVLYDEAEKQDARSDSRVQSVLALARSASSMDGAHTAKGTVHGQAMSFQVRSMFCLASIGGGVRQEADKTRISLLQLKSRGAISPEERREHWERYRPRLDRVTKDTGRELISRTLGWLRDGRLRETLDVMRAQAAIQLGDQRSGDQYGTLFAGAWVLMADGPPEAEEARELIAAHGLSSYIAEQASEGLRVLRTILQTEARVDTSSGPKTHAVGELVDACVTQSSMSDDASKWLRSHGLRVDARNGEWVLALANTSEWIQHALRDTPYSDGWHTQLRTLPGVTQGSPKRFHAGLTSRVTIIPRDAYD